MNKRVLISILALVLVCCLCASAVTLATGGVLLFGNQSFASLLTSSTSTLRPTYLITPTTLSAGAQSTATPDIAVEVLTTTPESSPTSSSATTGQPASLPADITAQMDEIQTQVERLRGMVQLDPVKRLVLTPEQLRQKITAEFAKENDAQSVKDDLRVLSAFGLIDPDFDLYNFYINLYSEQVAGYYDDKTKEMVVIQGESFDGPERMTYAHEFTHILQDQYFGLQDGLKLNEEHCLADSEYCAAVNALIEGDASLTEQYWLYTYGSETDKQQIDAFYAALQSPVYDAAPEFIKEDFGFSYTAGAEFVINLFEKGGYTDIDNAYAEPPVSTEQIMHPDKYPSDTPVKVFMPDLAAELGLNMREIDRGVIGEWYTYLMLAKGRSQSIRLSDAQARQAANGWGGDSYVVYQDNASGNTILAARWVWDTKDDAVDFFAGFKDYGKLRWGQPDISTQANTIVWSNTPDGTVMFQSNGLGTAWVMAPDNETAGLLLQSLSAGAHAGIN